MKVQEIVQLTNPNLPGTTRSVAGDQTVRRAVPVEMPNPIVGRQELLGSQDTFAVVDPNDGVTDEPPSGSIANSRTEDGTHARS